MQRLVVKIFFLLVIAALVATAAPAQDETGDLIPAGIDVWKTVANGTHVDFSDNPIPAGTFCANSRAFSGQIPMKGRRICSSPNLGTTDTIIERLEDAYVPVGGEDTIDMRIAALSLVGQSTFNICNTDWDVDVYLNPDEQELSTLTISRNSSSGGTFDAWLHVWAYVRFVSDRGTVIVSDHVSLHTQSAFWSANPTGAVTASGSVDIDTDGDCVVDTTVPGTSNFHPGYNGNTPVQVVHDGPHPTEPPKKCKEQQVDDVEPLGGALDAPAATAIGVEPIAACPQPVPVEEVQPVLVVN